MMMPFGSCGASQDTAMDVAVTLKKVTGESPTGRDTAVVVWTVALLPHAYIVHASS